MRFIAYFFLILLPSLAVAGGNSVLGKVTEVSDSDGNYSFKFEQTDEHPALVTGCKSFTVQVRYEHVPWFSWLPFIHSSHPTREQTERAAAVISHAYSEQKKIYFGYMGGGLMPSGNDCSFFSKGLLMMKENEVPTVLSFNREV